MDYKELEKTLKQCKRHLPLGKHLMNFMRWLEWSEGKSLWELSDEEFLSYLKEYISALNMCKMFCGFVLDEFDNIGNIDEIPNEE